MFAQTFGVTSDYRTINKGRGHDRENVTDSIDYLLIRSQFAYLRTFRRLTSQ